MTYLYWVSKRICILWCSDYYYTLRTNEASVYEQEIPWETEFRGWQYIGSQLWKMVFGFLGRISDKWHWINSYCSSLMFCRFFSQFSIIKNPLNLSKSLENTKPAFSIGLKVNHFRHSFTLPEFNHWGSTIFQAKTFEKKKIFYKMPLKIQFLITQLLELCGSLPCEDREIGT